MSARASRTKATPPADAPDPAPAPAEAAAPAEVAPETAPEPEPAPELDEAAAARRHAKAIKAHVGRPVQYLKGEQPTQAALIAGVNEDGTLNLAVFDHHGALSQVLGVSPDDIEH